MRQQFYTNPWEKKFETFQNFSGGLNTTTSQDNMRDNELTDAVNMRISERGALVPDFGTVAATELNTGTNGKGQGIFRFYQNGVAKKIVAKNGQFYVDGVLKSITGIPSFQATEPIQGVQFKDKMYFATGTRLVQYDGTTFSTVNPYRPQPLEALYIGLNGLADDPQNFMQDGSSAIARIDGVTFEERYGVVNKAIKMNVYVSQPANQTLEYKIERRYSTDPNGFWFLSSDWTTSKSHILTVPKEGSLEFKVSIRDSADPVYTVEEEDENGDPVTKTYDKIIADYYVPKYKVKPAPDPEDVQPNVAEIEKCRNILLHWNRLVLYGDPINPDIMYVSHLNQPDYFPIPNTLRFENPRNEKLNVLLPFRGMLIAFTDTSIQALYGSSPYDFKRVMLNTSVGCIAPKSAVVMLNYATFLGEDGVYILKTLGYTEDKANVERIDYKVENEIVRDPKAVGYFHEGEYHLVSPSANKRMRYNYELQAWMKDVRPIFNLADLQSWDGQLYAQRLSDGKVVRFEEGVYQDMGVAYTSEFSTKHFSFGQPYHRKKFKELQIITDPSVSTSLDFYIQASDEEITKDVKTGTVTIGQNQQKEYEKSILPLKGRALKTQVRIAHTLSQPYEVIGFGFIFKVKKP